MSTRIAVIGGVFLSIVSGVLSALSAPPYKAWPLIFLAFVPMIVAQHRVFPARLSWLAPAITISIWFSSQILAALVEARVPFVFRMLPIYVGLLAATFAWRSRRFHEETGYRWFVFTTPVAWVGLDVIRGAHIGEFAGTWGNPVYALWSQPWLLQPVSVVGSYGLELLLLMMNWAMAGIIIARQRTWRSAIGILAVCVLWVSASTLLLPGQGRTIRVAAIQPGPTVDDDDELRANFTQTRLAAAAGARVIVWREAGVPFDVRVRRTSEFANLARESTAYLVIGFSDRLPDRRELNMAAVFSPEGELLGSYGKDHPIRFARDSSDEHAGYPVWTTPLARLATIICADLDYTDTARAMARAGAEIIAVPSHDPVPALARTHYTHLVFRAIENRVALIKADEMRDGAIVDPAGRVVAIAVDRDGKRSTLVADVLVGTHDSLLIGLGDWLGWLCLIITSALAVRRIVFYCSHFFHQPAS